jgi:hypothetical protein
VVAGQALVRELGGQVVVHRATTGALRLAEHLPELREHMPELADVEPTRSAGHAGHAREATGGHAGDVAEAERILWTVARRTLGFVVPVTIAVGGPEAERGVAHAPTVRVGRRVGVRSP